MPLLLLHSDIARTVTSTTELGSGGTCAERRATQSGENCLWPRVVMSQGSAYTPSQMLRQSCSQTVRPSH